VAVDSGRHICDRNGRGKTREQWMGACSDRNGARIADGSWDYLLVKESARRERQ